MIVGNKEFGFEINKAKDHDTEFKMFINEKNILEFKFNGESRTTTWNIDDVINFLHNDVLKFTSKDNQFPIDVEGISAAEKANNAREFDTEDEEEFDKYYDALNDWVYEHSWQHECQGGYIADVIFRKVGDNIEISWDNRELYEDVEYANLTGYKLIDITTFTNTIIELFDDYNNIWN